MRYFIAGALLLCFFATLQKTLIGAPLVLKGYFIPFIFGSVSGLFIGILRFREKQYFQEFQTSSRKFFNLANGISSGISIIIDGNNFWINQAFADIFGYSKTEMIGRGIDFVIVPENIPQLLTYMKKELNGQNAVSNFETEAVRKDGKKINIDITAKQVEFDDQKAIQIVVRNITKLKQIELERETGEIKYKMLFENAPVGIGICESDGSIIDANQVMLSLYGYKKEEFLKLNIADTYINKEDRNKLNDELSRNQIVTNFQTQFIRKNNTIFDALINVQSIVLNKKTINFASVFDITKQIEIDAELKKHQDNLEELVNERTKNLAESRKALTFLMEDVNESRAELTKENAQSRRLEC
ncbi:MAG: PAS domain S-box protein [Candidatus Cloacimonetes bacterium]|nr:PAS domain S-box protein [Candidatus Cloacimonadota bacterium]